VISGAGTQKKECHSERSEESENSEWKAFERKRQSALLGRIVIRPYESSRFEALPFLLQPGVLVWACPKDSFGDSSSPASRNGDGLH